MAQNSTRTASKTKKQIRKSDILVQIIQSIKKSCQANNENEEL